MSTRVTFLTDSRAREMSQTFVLKEGLDPLLSLLLSALCAAHRYKYLSLKTQISKMTIVCYVSMVLLVIQDASSFFFLQGKEQNIQQNRTINFLWEDANFSRLKVCCNGLFPYGN